MPAIKTNRMMKEYDPESERIFYLFVDDGLVWFMNNSPEVLPQVTGSEGGFATADDDVVTFAGKKPVYKKVKSGEAVSIAVEPDGYDLDYIIRYYVTVISPQNEQLEFSSKSKKGGHPHDTLLWDESKKRANAIKREKEKSLREEEESLFARNMSSVQSRRYSTSDRFANALQFAERIHRGQNRKKTAIPYISHILAVSSIVMEHGGTEDQATAALLHDAVEDGGDKEDGGGKQVLDKIIAEFGKDVGKIVKECSDSISEKPKAEKEPWERRKVAYIESLPDKSYETLLVICADKLHNLRCIVADVTNHGPSVFKRFNASPNDTFWYYESVINALNQRNQRYTSVIREQLLGELEKLKNLVG